MFGAWSSVPGGPPLPSSSHTESHRLPTLAQVGTCHWGSKVALPTFWIVTSTGALSVRPQLSSYARTVTV